MHDGKSLLSLLVLTYDLDNDSFLHMASSLIGVAITKFNYGISLWLE